MLGNLSNTSSFLLPQAKTCGIFSILPVAFNNKIIYDKITMITKGVNTMFEKRLNKINENDQMKQHEPRPNLREKKERSMLRTYEEPVLPKLCRIIFFFMIIITIAMLLVDINAFVRYDSHLGIRHLLTNLSTTGFLDWLVFTVILLLLCVPGIKLNERKFYQQQKNSGIEAKTENEKLRNQRAIRRLNSAYIFYIKVCVIGIIIWGILYLLLVVI